MFANRFGVLNLSILSAASCGILVFSMLGIRDFTGVIIFGLLFGFFAGACQSRHPSYPDCPAQIVVLDISLLPPSIAILSDDMSEIGARLGICLGIGGTRFYDS